MWKFSLLKLLSNIKSLIQTVLAPLFMQGNVYYFKRDFKNLKINFVRRILLSIFIIYIINCFLLYHVIARFSRLKSTKKLQISVTKAWLHTAAIFQATCRVNPT